MSLSQQILLSNSSRERCISKLKELTAFVEKNKKPKTKAAVLVPICVENGEVCLLYTLRSANLKSHTSQVSFPGGKRDRRENFVVTALRETEEEIGIPRNDIEVWAEMKTVQGRNKDMHITPIVGVIKDYHVSKLQPNPNEVAEVFTVSMKELCDQNNHAHLWYKNAPLPIFLCKGHRIWGITGFITHLFLQSFLPSELYDVDFMRKSFTMEELIPGSKL